VYYQIFDRLFLSLVLPYKLFYMLIMIVWHSLCWDACNMYGIIFVLNCFCTVTCCKFLIIFLMFLLLLATFIPQQLSDLLLCLSEIIPGCLQSSMTAHYFVHYHFIIWPS